jgi:hypothetical protein
MAALLVTSAFAAPPDNLVLPVPQRSQADGTVWASSNCGPAAISEVLEAFGQKLPTKVLRDRANQLLGISDPNTGTRIQDLAQVVREHGLTVTGPYDGGKFRRWTLDDVRAEIQAGHPVVVQVYYPLLPNHRGSGISTDHYVAIVGISGDGFVFNDSADRDAPGYHQEMTADQFTRAWGASQQPFGAFSVEPGDGSPSLLPPPPPAPDPTPDTQQLAKAPATPPATANPAAAQATASATPTVPDAQQSTTANQSPSRDEAPSRTADIMGLLDRLKARLGISSDL